MTVPAGALSQSVDITVSPFASAPAGIVPGTAYSFGPDGTTFAAPATVTIAYDPAQLPSGAQDADLGLALLDGSGWTPLAGSIVDPGAHTVTGTTSHFSTLGVMARPPVVRALSRASVGPGGVEGDGDSPPITALGRASLSRDGSLVAFSSSADNLVADDTNGTADVFVRDLGAGTTRRASLTSAGEEGRAPSGYPALSGDGRYVVFASQANLDPADTSSQLLWDLYRYDLASSTTALVDVDSGGLLGQSFPPVPAVSGDGRFVAWRDFATPRILVKDMASGTVDEVAVPLVPAQFGDLFDPAISDDGQVIAFVSSHVHVSGQANPYPSLFVVDRAAGTTERIAAGTGAEAIPPTIGMSADGTVVAYASTWPALVPDDNAAWDVYAYVRSSPPSLWLVSVGVQGVASSGPSGFGSFEPFVSADGSTVAYTSTATNLVAGVSGGGAPQVFVRATYGGRTYQLSTCGGATAANGTSGGPTLSGDGQAVAFWSVASNLLGTPGSCTLDGNGKVDVFVAR